MPPFCVLCAPPWRVSSDSLGPLCAQSRGSPAQLGMPAQRSGGSLAGRTRAGGTLHRAVLWEGTVYSQVSTKRAESPQQQKLYRPQGGRDPQPLQSWARKLMQKDPEAVESNGKRALLKEED